jgi:hypothetical protein
MNPVYIITLYFFNIHFNIILSFLLVLPTGLMPSGYRTKMLFAFLTFYMRAAWPTHDFITLKYLEEIKKYEMINYEIILHYSFTFSFMDPNILIFT